MDKYLQSIIQAAGQLSNEAAVRINHPEVQKFLAKIDGDLWGLCDEMDLYSPGNETCPQCGKQKQIGDSCPHGCPGEETPIKGIPTGDPGRDGIA